MDAQQEKDEKKIIKISVRNLVEFILREGDIDNRHGRTASPEAMWEGSRIHKRIQKNKGANYHAEVPLKIELSEEDYTLAIEGRADGIEITCDGERQLDFSDNFNHLTVEEDMHVTIDEIKGIYMNLDALGEPVGVHRAQAMCYAYIYALQHDLAEISVQLTYCNLDTIELTKTAFLGNLKYFRETFSFAELAEWFTRLTDEYKKWADFQFAWQNLRQASIKKLEFPYAYRKGQKELASDVYRTIARRKNLFIQAPTGVGKTISTVFPAVKAVGEGLGDKIFYLTAKTITGTVAKEAFELLRTRGYQAKIIWLTAKEKLCLCEEMDCNPVHCPYAKGHYDRVNDAVYNLLQKEDVFTREVILEQAREYRVCPFEMSLDTATWADDIIGDYNYVFDPNVYLKRFFAEGTRGNYIFLVDEAHNLVERSREMYSASIYKEDFLAAKKLLKPYQEKHDRRAERVIRHLEKCNRILLGYKRECENYVVYENIGTLIFALTRLAADLDEYLQKSPDFPEHREVNEFYLNLRNFMNIYELVDEHYVVYSEHEEDGRFKLKFYCVDPSLNLQERIDKGNATIFFSATLLPIQYYKSLLSTRRDKYAVYAQTAFSEEQRLLLFGNDVSSKYTRRGRAEYERIALYIEKTARAKQGNYMVFFPSYRMMQEVYDVFLEGGETDEMRPQEYFPEGAENAEIVEHPEDAEIAEHPEDAEIAEHPNDAENSGNAEPRLWCMMQQTGMREAEREAFLQAFSGETSKRRGGSLVAFCVLGGIFGEGIDLKKEQLIGAVIVGTGLPQVCLERELLKNYFDSRGQNGFDYAYVYPGMIKVLQAAGRCIRTDDDKGVILLLDNRYSQRRYQSLFPYEWYPNFRVRKSDDVKTLCEKFWNK